MEFILVGYFMKDGGVDNITCKGKKTFSSQITGYYLYTQRVKKLPFFMLAGECFGVLTKMHNGTKVLHKNCNLIGINSVTFTLIKIIILPS